ncbi:hypothetical protein [Niastella vici]|nr:hypothetical protein [Niastella vici]
MANISQSKHRFFSQTLDDTIKKLEVPGLQELSSATIVRELKKELFLLENIFAEYDSKTKQLKHLISQYQKIQHDARIRLRICQQICSKQ